MERENQEHQTEVQMVLAPPDQVYAAADVHLQVKVACPEKCDLRGGRVRISDEEGAIGEIDLTAFDGVANQTDVIFAQMPVEPGSYTWTALFLPDENEQVQHEPSSATFGFAVQPHRILISVWDAPTPVTRGERFTLKVGAKCSAGCSVAGLPFTIEDGNGGQVATGTLGETVLPRTSDTYWAEQELVAPSEEGLCKWSASLVPSGLELPHEVSPKQFTFYAAQPPEHTVTVQVVDAGSKKPREYASIFIDRRRASTDAHGMARVEVSKGSHTLYVSLEHYEPFKTTVEVAGDVTVEAGLKFCPDQYTIADSKISF